MTRWVDDTVGLEVVTPDGSEIIRVAKGGSSKGVRLDVIGGVAGAIMDSDFATDGIMVRTAEGIYASRSLSAGTGIALTNADGDAGDPSIALSSGAQASLALADTAVQPAAIDSMLEAADIGVSVQAYSSVLANTTASFTTTIENNISDIEAIADATVIATRSAIASATVPASVNAIYTAGRSSLLDDGGGMYVRAVSEPSHAGKVQSADGAWWELDEPVARPEMFGAVGDGSTDDSAAINAALTYVGPGGVVELLPKTYAHASQIAVVQNGQVIRGRHASDTFGNATQGTILKWTGSSGGTQLFFGRASDGAGDFTGGGLDGILFDGNALAAYNVHFRSCMMSTFTRLVAKGTLNDASSAGFWLDSGAQAWAGINSIYRASWRDCAVIASTSGSGIRIRGASDETSGRHPAFCTFSGVHITHDDGHALYVESADDMLFADLGVSRETGGTGKAIYLRPSAAGQNVVGLTFCQLHAGWDTPVIEGDGANGWVRGIAFYGLQGVDSPPTITQSNNARFDRIDYLGETYEGYATAGGYTKVNMILPDSFTVAQLASVSPSAPAIVHCWDGDGGSQCLAVWNTVNWLRVPLGAAVST